MADPVKRLRYFDGEFLRAADFQAEQSYHVRLRRNHYAKLWVAGIADGLDVVPSGATTVVVQPGSAIDSNGQDIVVANQSGPIDLSGFSVGTAVWIVANYGETDSDPSTPPSAAGNTRVTEAPQFAASATTPADPQVVLGKVTRTATGVTVDASVRKLLEPRALGPIRQSLATRIGPNGGTVSTLAVTGKLSVGGSSSLAGVTFSGRLAHGTTSPQRDVHIEGTEIHSGGGAGGFSFSNRGSGFVENGGNGDRWVLYASGNQAHLWSAGDKLSVNTAGDLTTGGRLHAAGLDASGGAALTWGNGSQLSADQGGSLELGGNSTVPGAGIPYIDFHFSGKTEDFNTRIINDQDGRLNIAATRLQVGDWNNPDVQVGVNQLRVNVGWAPGRALGWPNGYVGFNCSRTPDGIWHLNGDGVNNGGVALFGTIGGALEVATIQSTGGGNQTLTDAQVWGQAYMSMSSSGWLSAKYKNFRIEHPDRSGFDLVHSVLEGPEIAVFYRGEAELRDGEATVELPRYFESLVREEGRTVLLTPLVDDRGRFSPLACTPVEGGRFRVRAAEDGVGEQRFYWEVKAVRADVEPLEVEPEQGAQRFAGMLSSDDPEAPASGQPATAEPPAEGSEDDG